MAEAAPRIPKALASAVPILRIVRFPVLLPTEFDGIDLDRDHMHVPVNASRHHYTVIIDAATPSCGGVSQNVCAPGSIEGYDATYREANAEFLDSVAPRTPEAGDERYIYSHKRILDMPVTLAHGLTGFYTESPSGADEGGSSSLRWNDHGIEYLITTRISTRVRLTRIANSAIRNGPIF
jgi:hypothetical protein